MATALAYGLSYIDFLEMTLNEVLAYSKKVKEIRELNNFDLAVKIGQLFSEEGLKPPVFLENKGLQRQKVRDASELSEEERQYWINKIIGFQKHNVENIEKL